VVPGVCGGSLGHNPDICFTQMSPLTTILSLLFNQQEAYLVSGWVVPGVCGGSLGHNPDICFTRARLARQLGLAQLELAIHYNRGHAAVAHLQVPGGYAPLTIKPSKLGQVQTETSIQSAESCKGMDPSVKAGFLLDVRKSGSSLCFVRVGLY